jgi:hypothetical protein
MATISGITWASGVKQHGTGFDARIWDEFARDIGYFRGDLDTAARITRNCNRPSMRWKTNRPVVCTIWPRRLIFMVPACDHLAAAGMSAEISGQRRIVIEKPFGRDLASARELNQPGPCRVRRASGLSHRSLPGQGDGPEHHLSAVCQHPFRAGLEPAVRGQCPDHGGGKRGCGATRRLL